MSQETRLEVNGESVTVTTDPDRPLLEVLREDLHLTGTKYGCGEGECRACTVIVDGDAVPSCRMAIAEVANKSVRTIEGLARNDGLHPVQQAFLEAQAMQCGYCVPGMILTAVALLEKVAQPDDATIVDSMNGNICRCCGYVNLVHAVRRAAGLRTEEEDR